MHSKSRSRDDIWQALKDKNVYGTSGPRILLWFDLLNGPNGEASMGSTVTMISNPTFRVKAAGSIKQIPGCHEYSIDSHSEERLDYLCSGECYNPSSERYLIDRIEIIKITPQEYQGEPIEPLIQDKWKVIDCPKSNSGCVVEFEDPEYSRDSTYYVRAIQESTLAINGENITIEEGGEVNI